MAECYFSLEKLTYGWDPQGYVKRGRDVWEIKDRMRLFQDALDFFPAGLNYYENLSWGRRFRGTKFGTRANHMEYLYWSYLAAEEAGLKPRIYIPQHYLSPDSEPEAAQRYEKLVPFIIVKGRGKKRAMGLALSTSDRRICKYAQKASESRSCITAKVPLTKYTSMRFQAEKSDYVAIDSSNIGEYIKRFSSYGVFFGPYVNRRVEYARQRISTLLFNSTLSSCTISNKKRSRTVSHEQCYRFKSIDQGIFDTSFVTEHEKGTGRLVAQYYEIRVVDWLSDSSAELCQKPITWNRVSRLIGKIPLADAQAIFSYINRRGHPPSRVKHMKDYAELVDMLKEAHKSGPLYIRRTLDRCIDRCIAESGSDRMVTAGLSRNYEYESRRLERGGLLHDMDTINRFMPQANINTMSITRNRGEMIQSDLENEIMGAKDAKAIRRTRQYRTLDDKLERASTFSNMLVCRLGVNKERLYDQHVDKILFFNETEPQAALTGDLRLIYADAVMQVLPFMYVMDSTMDDHRVRMTLSKWMSRYAKELK